MIKYNPLYNQVKEVILQRIADGEYLPGSTIPSESKLSKDFGTSVSTIRQAISILIDDGILEIKKGKGTYVTSKKIKISFLTWLPESKQGQLILEGLIDLVHQKYPSIEVEYLPTTYPQARKELLKLISTGNAPDVAQIVSHWTSYFSSMGAFTPLENVLSKDNLNSRSLDKDLRGGIYQNKIYSVSWGLCPLALIANKNVLARAGIVLSDQPMTISSFFDTCKKVDAFYNGQNYSFGMCISNEETDFLRIYPFLQAFHGGFTDENGEIIFNSRENVKAFTWLKEFVNSCKVFKADIFKIRQLFARGEIAFIIDGPWIKYMMEEVTKTDFAQNFEVHLIPRNGDLKSYSWNYNHALAISSQSEKKLYAAKFIDAITNDSEISSYYYSRVGHLPCNIQHLKRENSGSNFYNTYKNQLENSNVMNAQNAMFEKAMLFCINAVEKILFENVEIEDELREKEEYLKMLYYES